MMCNGRTDKVCLGRRKEFGKQKLLTAAGKEKVDLFRRHLSAVTERCSVESAGRGFQYVSVCVMPSCGKWKTSPVTLATQRQGPDK